jgi:hypothetical protein
MPRVILIRETSLTRKNLFKGVFIIKYQKPQYIVEQLLVGNKSLMIMDLFQ